MRKMERMKIGIVREYERECEHEFEKRERKNGDRGAEIMGKH